MEANKIAVVDIETTGPNYQMGDRIIQIAAVVYQEGQILHQYSMLINPERSIPLSIQQLTGITDEAVIKAPAFKSVAELWQHRLKDAIFVAHNLSFDYEFLKYSFKQVGIEFNPLALDTVVLSKVLFYDALGFNLTDLSRYCGLTFDKAHDALADAQVTGKILSQLLYKLTEINQPIKDKIHKFIQHLPYNNDLFFTDSDWFMDHLGKYERLDQTEFVAQSVYPSQINFPEIGQLLNHSQPHLSIENRDLPIHPSFILQMAEALLKQGRRLLIASNHSETYRDYLLYHFHLDPQQIVLVAYPDEYIHLNSFQFILSRLNPEDLNQQELIMVSANLHWLANSQTGYYGEINQELIPQAFIEKYGRQVYHLYNHDYFNRMVEKIGQSSLVIIDPAYLSRLMDPSQKKLFNLDVTDFDLIIDNFKKFIQDHKRGRQKIADLSKLFNLFKQAYDNNTLPSNYLNRLEFEKILYKTGDIIDLLDIELTKGMAGSQQDNQIIYQTIYSDTVSGQVLLDQLASWQEDMKRFANKFSDLIPGLFIREEISRQIHQILSMDFTSSQFLFQIQVDQIDGFLYHFKIFQSPWYFKSSQTSYLNKFKHSFVFSQGLIFNHPANLYQEVFPLLDHERVLLELDNHFKPVKALIPIDYSCLDLQDPNRFNLMFEFYKDCLNSKKGKTIIFMENIQACQLAYQAFTHEDSLIKDLSVFSQTMTGSIQKIYRRFMEADHAIIFVTYLEWLKINKQPELLEMTIMISKLAFKNPEQDDILSIKRILNLAETDLFDQVIYPEMVEDFKEMLTYIPEFYIFKEVFIFDHRILSKSYSKKLQRDLSELIHFESYLT